MDTQKLILKNFLQDDGYARLVMPLIDRLDYFEDEAYLIMKLVLKYTKKYKQMPNKDALFSLIQKTKYKDEEKKELREYAKGLYKPLDDKQNDEWLMNETEDWFQFRAYTLAIFEGFELLEKTEGDNGLDKNEKRQKAEAQRGTILEMMKTAQNKRINTSIGHDYFQDYKGRFDAYTGHGLGLRKYPFRLKKLNEATNGGVENKSLNIIVGGTGGGKTLSMCSLASDYLTDGLNVLYVTCEMADVKIAQRIDANLLNRNVNDILELGAPVYDEAINRLEADVDGRLVIKEYPARQATADHLRALLEELKARRGFIPDILFIDYLNLISPSTIGRNDSVYERLKVVAEEVRAIAQEYGICIWTATQTNRGGFKKSDLDADDTGESFGIPMTADFMIGVFADEKMQKANQLRITQMSKNRYEDIAKLPAFLVGCDRPKMKLYNLE